MVEAKFLGTEERGWAFSSSGSLCAQPMLSDTSLSPGVLSLSSAKTFSFFTEAWLAPSLLSLSFPSKFPSVHVVCEKESDSLGRLAEG